MSRELAGTISHLVPCTGGPEPVLFPSCAVPASGNLRQGGPLSHLHFPPALLLCSFSLLGGRLCTLDPTTYLLPHPDEATVARIHLTPPFLDIA